MQLLTVILAPGSINHVANIVKGYAIAIGVVFAIYMVWQWWQTREREAAIDRTARARSVWARHLTLALDHPQLTEMTADPANPLYRVYMASFLTASDEILALDPSDHWRDTLMRHMAPHRDFLASADAHDTLLRDCTGETRGLVQKISAA
jgi:hypothetical protein